MKRIPLCMFLCVLFLAGCAIDSNHAVTATASASGEAEYPGTDDGAHALLDEVGTGGKPDIILSLRPTSADYRTLFDKDFAIKAEAHYGANLWPSSTPSAPAPLAKPGQTVLRFWKATTDDIRAWTPQVRANFPGGYEKIRSYFNPGLTIYVWQYTRSGEEYGMAYNGLVYLNEHWAFFPKPWRVLDAKL